MLSNTRREFLQEIGRGMLIAGLGTPLAGELGIACGGEIDSASPPLDFGTLEPLVGAMQELSPEALIEELVGRLRAGTPLKTLVAAGALANARTFGGQDYVGFHTFMALAPAYRMAMELPAPERALPVLKVLHRNATRIQEFGGRTQEVLRDVSPIDMPTDSVQGEYLREVIRTGDIEKSDRTFATFAGMPAGEAFNHLQFAVEDEVDVHRVVLAWRGWDTLELAGTQWAQVLLRQSVRYCANSEHEMIERDRARSSIRQLLPELLEEYRLLDRPIGQRAGDDSWVEHLATTIFRGTREQAADAVAQALRESWSAESIGEAISIAANMLVLHDPGRPKEWASDEKPEGSCHGDSVGVHASDAANAWRSIVRVSNPRNVVASLIVGAYHTGGQSARSNAEPYPYAEHLAEIKTERPDELLDVAKTAIVANKQFEAAAAIARYSQMGHPAEPVFQLLVKFATSEDGALHAEKYYNTVRAEFATIREAFRWNQLVALARVTASEYGRTAAGYRQARELLQLG